MLMLGRVVIAIAHGSFFAIGTTVAARLASQGQASKAIALRFSGLTLAMVMGVPLGSLLGTIEVNGAFTRCAKHTTGA